jgi:ELWxxDGT repeat protein
MDDVFTGSHGSFPSDLVSFGSYLYFAAETSNEGRELWRTKGTDFAEAELVSVHGSASGIWPGLSDANPKFLTVANDVPNDRNFMCFAATEGQRGRELWCEVKNLITQGTRLEYIDVTLGKESSSPQYLTSSGGDMPLFFSATDPVHGREIWITDGTAAGTSMIMDINPVGDSNPSYLTWYKDRIYFQASDGVIGSELWVTDGTLGGTSLIQDIRIGSGSSNPSFFYDIHF